MDRSEPNLSPATDISTIPLRWTAYTQGQPIASLSHRDQTIPAEKSSKNKSDSNFYDFNPWIWHVPGDRSSPAPLPMWIGNGIVQSNAALFASSDSDVAQGPLIAEIGNRHYMWQPGLYMEYHIPQIDTIQHHYNYNYCATPHYIQELRVRWPLQRLQPLQKTQLQPPFGASVASLCHPWFTTTNLSYRFPISETSATALCGTTGILEEVDLWGYPVL